MQPDLNTFHLVDPELLPLVDRYADRILSAETLHARRKAAAEAAPANDGAEDGLAVGVRRCLIPPQSGTREIPVVIVSPAGSGTDSAAMLHCHGGGFVIGTASQVLLRLRRQASELDCVIVSVDYTLAPEAPFPVAIEECYSVLKWLSQEAPSFGIDTTRIGVMGESAGGGLAAALALLARDRGGPQICFQSLLYPMLDDRTDTSNEPNSYTGQFVWTRESNNFGWSSLLGAERGGHNVSPYAAPARATTLADLPATYIAVGALDLLVDENITYAHRLVRAGVPVELIVYPGAVHGFNQAPEAAIAREAEAHRTHALSRALNAKR